MRWYVNRKGKTKGPFDKADVISAVAAGQIGLDDTVCQEGTEDWIPVRELGAFAAAAPSTTVVEAPAAMNPRGEIPTAVPKPSASALETPAAIVARRADGGRTAWIEHGEKLARLLLWLALAAAVVIVPIEYVKHHRLEAAARESVRQEGIKRAKEEKAAAEVAKAESEKIKRLPLSSFRPVLTLLDGTIGRLWITNVSERSGVVCVIGIATNPVSRGTSESLPACKAIEPYASNVEISVMFAGGELRPMCRDVTCSLQFEER